MQRQQENLLATGLSEVELEDLLNWDPPMAPQRPIYAMQGRCLLSDLVSIKLADLKKHMKHLTTNLHTQVCARVKMWPLLSAALEGFGDDFA